MILNARFLVCALILLLCCAFSLASSQNAAPPRNAKASATGKASDAGGSGGTHKFGIFLFEATQERKALVRQRDELRFLRAFNRSREGDAVRVTRIERDLRAIDELIENLKTSAHGGAAASGGGGVKKLTEAERKAILEEKKLAKERKQWEALQGQK